MANYPVNISLSKNTGIILEITDDDPVDAIPNTGFAQGYVRQIGALVENCDIDDNVYYNTSETMLFSQSGITFVFADASNILFVQTALP